MIDSFFTQTIIHRSLDGTSGFGDCYLHLQKRILILKSQFVCKCVKHTLSDVIWVLKYGVILASVMLKQDKLSVEFQHNGIIHIYSSVR